MPDELLTTRHLDEALRQFEARLTARIERLETSLLLSKFHDYAFAGHRRVGEVEIQTKATHERLQLQSERIKDLERRLQQIERRLDLGPAAA